MERQREREAGALVCCGLGAHRNTVVCLRTTMLNHTFRSQRRERNVRRGQTFFFLPANPHSELTQKGPRNGVHGLRGHTYDTLGKRSPLESGEAQVADLD